MNTDHSHGLEIHRSCETESEVNGVKSVLAKSIELIHYIQREQNDLSVQSVTGFTFSFSFFILFYKYEGLIKTILDMYFSCFFLFMFAIS